MFAWAEVDFSCTSRHGRARPGGRRLFPAAHTRASRPIISCGAFILWARRIMWASGPCCTRCSGRRMLCRSWVASKRNRCTQPRIHSGGMAVDAPCTLRWDIHERNSTVREGSGALAGAVVQTKRTVQVGCLRRRARRAPASFALFALPPARPARRHAPLPHTQWPYLFVIYSASTSHPVREPPAAWFCIAPRSHTVNVFPRAVARPCAVPGAMAC